jgi:acyl-coenzyme A thioesterase PaaI-like protein
MAIWTRPIDLDQLTAMGRGNLQGLLDIQFTGCGEDWLRARMPVTERVHQPFGRLHGGASVVLAETVASVAGAMAVPDGKVTVGSISTPIMFVPPAAAMSMPPPPPSRLAARRRSGRSASRTMPASSSACRA